MCKLIVKKVYVSEILTKYTPFSPFELFVDVVFKYTTGTIIQQGAMSILCNVIYFGNVFSQASFYRFVNQTVYIDAKCTCFAHSMLHLAVIISDILKCSTRERVRLVSMFNWRVIDYVLTNAY